jgi:endonuclease/exonuclease/phosphatase family metal-dependent hydrolase
MKRCLSACGVPTPILPTTRCYSHRLPAKVILSRAAIHTVATVDIPANPSVARTMEQRMSLVRVLDGQPDSLELVVDLAKIVS